VLKNTDERHAARHVTAQNADGRDLGTNRGDPTCCQASAATGGEPLQQAAACRVGSQPDGSSRPLALNR